MVLEGNEIIIMTKEDAALLLRAIYKNWRGVAYKPLKEELKQLQKIGALQIVEKLRAIVMSDII